MGYQILIIDDDPAYLQLAKMNLAQKTHRITAVTDPHEGLQLAKQSNFDLIILDVGMPSMNGIEVSELLDAKFPILMVSANPRPNQFADKYDVFLSKRQPMHELVRGVEEAVQKWKLKHG